jgi:hypothetical protein
MPATRRAMMRTLASQFARLGFPGRPLLLKNIAERKGAFTFPNVHVGRAWGDLFNVLPRRQK